MTRHLLRWMERGLRGATGGRKAGGEVQGWLRKIRDKQVTEPAAPAG